MTHDEQDLHAAGGVRLPKRSRGTPGYAQSRQMRILFALQHPGYVRNYESTLRLLAERGHAIHLAFTEPNKQADEGVAERLAAEYPSITCGRAPLRTDDRWAGIAWSVRLVMDYVRYLHPRYRNAPKL